MTKDEIRTKIADLIKQWVNQPTLMDDGWTAAHLATKSKHKIFVFLIEKLGANVHLRNKNGVSLMHKAALDDNTFAITYLRDKCSIGIMDTDL